MRNYATAGLRALLDAGTVERNKITERLAKIRREIKRREALDAKRVSG